MKANKGYLKILTMNQLLKLKAWSQRDQNCNETRQLNLLSTYRQRLKRLLQKMETGDIEIHAKELKVLGTCISNLPVISRVQNFLEVVTQLAV